MNLLGLMMSDIIERNLAQSDHHLVGLSGSVVVIGAGAMRITLHFDSQSVQIRRGAAPQPDAAIIGTMDVLLSLAFGAIPLAPLISGKLKVAGNPLTLLRLRPLLAT